MSIPDIITIVLNWLPKFYKTAVDTCHQRWIGDVVPSKYTVSAKEKVVSLTIVNLSTDYMMYLSAGGIDGKSNAIPLSPGKSFTQAYDSFKVVRFCKDIILEKMPTRTDCDGNTIIASKGMMVIKEHITNCK